MNDVNLNNTEYSPVTTGDKAPLRALSSSQAEGRNASDLAASSAGSMAPNQSVQRSDEPTRAEELRARNQDQRKGLEDAVTQLNDFVQSVQRDLQFEVDTDAGQTTVKVVDQKTQEVIRQIPDEVALRLAEKLQQDEPLTLLHIKV